MREGNGVGRYEPSLAGGFPGTLTRWARDRGDATALIHLEAGERETERWSFAELSRRALTIAATLAAADLRGKPVLMIYPSGLDFAAAFCACLHAGAIATPIPFLTPRAALDRVRRIAAHTKPAAVLGIARAQSSFRIDPSDVPELAGIPWIMTDSLPDEVGACAPVPSPWDPLAPALLQYSSGSTGQPKGVVISHANLHANLDMLSAAFGTDTGSVFVSWLPMFHDMGLVSALLHSLHVGAACILMPPAAFLQRPLRWLQAIDTYRGTVSGAPNFAYELCVDRAAGKDLSDLDLGSWSLAYCAAEPVRAGTMARFADRFAGSGFRRNALFPCYGLAEATVFVSGPGERTGVRTLDVDARALARNEISPAIDEEPHRTLVGCGRSWLGQTAVIVDPETCRPVPENRIGEVWVAGPHVAAGYWNAPESTSAGFGAVLAGTTEPLFLRTGDLGAMIGDELYIAGRLRDLIIVRGANFHPQDIEATVAGSHPAFAADRAAAFCIDVDEAEQVVVACEVSRHHLRTLDGQALAAAAVEAVNREFGIRLYDLVLLSPNALPLTTSGKVQRRQCRQSYLDGTLRTVGGAVRFPGLGIARTLQTTNKTP